MKSRARYGLIAFGIAAFVLLSPLIVLFVSGLKYDFKAHAFVQTGTLYVQSNPTDAKIYINGSEAGSTSQNIRFMTPGSYDLAIKKDGYFDWDKNLIVKARYVTSASELPKGVTLFYSVPLVKGIANNINSFFAGKNRIIYLDDNNVYSADIPDPANSQQLALPHPFNDLTILAAPSENYFLLQDQNYTAVFDVQNNKLFDISDLASSKTSLQFSNDDKLYSLQNGSLYQIDWNAPAKNVLFQNVLAFYPTPEAIYFIQNQKNALGSTQNLVRAHLPSLEEKILVSNLPHFNQARLYLSQNNQLFILGDGELYTGDENPNLIADNVQYAAIDNSNGKLLYATPNEIDLYDLFSGTTSLVTRSSRTITNAIGAFDLGVIFFINDGRLQNIELDTRDHQNNYTFEKVSDNALFYLDPDEQNVFLLDNKKLQEIKIR